MLPCPPRRTPCSSNPPLPCRLGAGGAAGLLPSPGQQRRTRRVRGCSFGTADGGGHRWVAGGCGVVRQRLADRRCVRPSFRCHARSSLSAVCKRAGWTGLQLTTCLSPLLPLMQRRRPARARSMRRRSALPSSVQRPARAASMPLSSGCWPCCRRAPAALCRNPWVARGGGVEGPACLRCLSAPQSSSHAHGHGLLPRPVDAGSPTHPPCRWHACPAPAGRGPGR